MSITKGVPLKSNSSMKKNLERFWYFLTYKIDFESQILPFLTTFTQLTARPKYFLRGWLLVLSLKEGLVECATVCVKSEVILKCE